MRKMKPIIANNAREFAGVLGLSETDAVEMEVRAQLNEKIIRAVKASGFTHEQVAKLAETSRTRLTAILNRDTSHVSTDLMLRILSSLGYRAKMVFRKVRHAA